MVENLAGGEAPVAHDGGAYLTHAHTVAPSAAIEAEALRDAVADVERWNL